MKKSLSLILVISVFCCIFSGCSFTKLDKNRDSQGHIQFIAEFNKRLFAYTNEENSGQAYTPYNPALENTFSYGINDDVLFTAVYSANEIIYTVDNPSEDRISEAKTFYDIYEEYSDSWNNYIKKTDVGVINTDSNSVESASKIEMLISGYSYTVSFDPYADKPTIIYKVTEIS